MYHPVYRKTTFSKGQLLLLGTAQHGLRADLGERRHQSVGTRVEWVSGAPGHRCAAAMHAADAALRAVTNDFTKVLEMPKRRA